MGIIQSVEIKFTHKMHSKLRIVKTIFHLYYLSMSYKIKGEIAARHKAANVFLFISQTITCLVF